MENVNLEDTIPMEEQSNQAPGEVNEAASLPEEAAAETEPAAQQSEEMEVPSDTESPFLAVQFNHESQNLTREQAVEFAQKGLLYEKISPFYNKLDYLASQRNMGVNELVSSLLEAEENTYRQQLTEKLGEDTQLVEDMMTLYRNRNGEKYNKLLADRAKAEQKEGEERKEQFSEQLEALQKEFPEISSAADLPEEVMQLSGLGQVNLTAAYLLHKHKETKRIAQAEAIAAEQSKKTTGSVQSAENAEASAVDAFIRGVQATKF